MPTRIVVVIPELIAYYRQAVAGVARFCRMHDLVAAFIRPESLSELPQTPADGIIAAMTTPVLVDRVARRKLPTVNISSRIETVPCPSVRVDHLAVADLAAEHFLHRGFRSFAYVSPTGPWYASVRGDRFAERLRAAGHACHLFDAGPDTAPARGVARIRQRFAKFIQSLAQPVAVLAVTDFWGWQLIEACRNAGLAIPAQVAILGVDNDEMVCEMSTPSLSSIDVAAERIGFVAADLLARMMANPRARHESTLLVEPARLVVRNSSDTVATSDPDVAAALRLIRERVGEPFQVKDLLAALPISRRTLERRFELTLGHSPAREIRRTKIDRAKQLLAESDLTLTRIAAAVGFEYLSHFSAVFRQETGKSPSAYRLQFRFS